MTIQCISGLIDSIIWTPFPYRYGGWIFDNFPANKEQWAVLIEKNMKAFMPDQVIYLQDDSTDGEVLTGRWYSLNKEELDTKIHERLAVELMHRKQQTEEER